MISLVVFAQDDLTEQYVVHDNITNKFGMEFTRWMMRDFLRDFFSFQSINYSLWIIKFNFRD